MLPEKLKSLLKKQHYELVGKNSAVQVCSWTKKSLRDEDFCYKQKFYGINSHRCCQMTPCVEFCDHKCLHCWRAIQFTKTRMKKSDVDDPAKIIDACITAQKKLLRGFGGNKHVKWDKYRESLEPRHFAISLAGEPTIYPKLPELIKELDKRKITSFIVSNGENPGVLKKIKPTQLYISLNAPNEKLFKKICGQGSNWKNLMKSLEVLKKKRKETRTVLRMTLIKNLNMIEPENYAKLIKMAEPMFIEIKGFMHIGYAQKRLPKEAMPEHFEVLDFARKISEKSSYTIVDQKENSRVVLMMQHDTKNRVMKFKN